MDEIKNVQPSGDVSAQELLHVMNKVSKELKLTRIFCGVLGVLVLAMLVVCCLFAGRAKQYEKQVEEYAKVVDGYWTEIQPVLTQLSQVDVEAFNEALANIESVDVEAINRSIDDINTEALGETITRLDEVLDVLDNASKKLKEITSGIGGFFRQ